MLIISFSSPLPPQSSSRNTLSWMRVFRLLLARRIPTNALTFCLKILIYSRIIKLLCFFSGEGIDSFLSPPSLPPLLLSLLLWDAQIFFLLIGAHLLRSYKHANYFSVVLPYLCIWWHSFSKYSTGVCIVIRKFFLLVFCECVHWHPTSILVCVFLCVCVNFYEGQKWVYFFLEVVVNELNIFPVDFDCC